MRRAEITTTEGILLPDGSEIEKLDEGGGYKYLGILEMDWVMHEERKKSLSKEYFGEVRKLLQSMLNESDIMSGINL